MGLRHSSPRRHSQRRPSGVCTTAGTWLLSFFFLLWAIAICGYWRPPSIDPGHRWHRLSRWAAWGSRKHRRPRTLLTPLASGGPLLGMEQRHLLAVLSFGGHLISSVFIGSRTLWAHGWKLLACGWRGADGVRCRRWRARRWGLAVLPSAAPSAACRVQ